MSARPIPCFPPMSFNLVRSATGVEPLTVDGDRCAVLEADRDVFRRCRRVGRIRRKHEEIFRRDAVRVLEDSAFVRDVPDVAVARIDLRGRRRHGNVVRGRIGERVFATPDVPYAPRGDDRQVGRKRHVSEFEAYLIVPLAGATVRQGVRADFARDLDLFLRDQRARHRRAEQVFAVVDRTSAQGGPDEITHIFEAQIFDVTLLGARRDRFFAHALQLGFTLPDIGGHADDPGIVVLAQPGDDDRSVEAARVGEGDGAHAEAPLIQRLQ